MIPTFSPANLQTRATGDASTVAVQMQQLIVLLPRVMLKRSLVPMAND